MQFQKICILGLGYIGLPTASTFAMHGIQVVGVDVNQSVVETLRKGGLHIQEPGLLNAFKEALRSGKLVIQHEPEAADAFIIAVPTPFQGNKQADLRAVRSASESIARYLRPGNLVVLESTSPPRTTVDVVLPILEAGSGLRGGVDFGLAYSPERVLPGQILRELIENARVIGGIDPASAQAGRDLYASFVKGEIFTTDATTAEMVKLMENTFRDVNIAIANEFARLADRFGVDVWEAIRIANRHPRVKILNPGPGVGGHCISVDPWFLVEAAPDLTQLISAARHVNDAQPAYVVDRLRSTLGGDLTGKRITALGLSFKPDVDDYRESPAVEVVHLLKGAGAVVTAYDPVKPDIKLEGIDIQPDFAAAARDADVLLLLVNDQAFKAYHPAEIAALTPARFVMDTVNGFDQSAWREAGFTFLKLGNGCTEAQPALPRNAG